MSFFVKKNDNMDPIDNLPKINDKVKYTINDRVCTIALKWDIDNWKSELLSADYKIGDKENIQLNLLLRSVFNLRENDLAHNLDKVVRLTLEFKDKKHIKNYIWDAKIMCNKTSFTIDFDKLISDGESLEFLEEYQWLFSGNNSFSVICNIAIEFKENSSLAKKLLSPSQGN